eukprot:scaffold93687_cov78-Phaeocystis_antarctica.AAC.5
MLPWRTSTCRQLGTHPLFWPTRLADRSMSSRRSRCGSGPAQASRTASSRARLTAGRSAHRTPVARWKVGLLELPRPNPAFALPFLRPRRAEQSPRAMGPPVFGRRLQSTLERAAALPSRRSPPTARERCPDRRKLPCR